MWMSAQFLHVRIMELVTTKSTATDVTASQGLGVTPASAVSIALDPLIRLMYKSLYM